MDNYRDAAGISHLRVNSVSRIIMDLITLDFETYYDREFSLSKLTEATSVTLVLR